MPYLHLRKLYSKSVFLLLFIIGVFTFQFQLFAEDIELNNGKVLKDATIVGETDKALIIQYDGGVESFHLSLLPVRYHPAPPDPPMVVPTESSATDESVSEKSEPGLSIEDMFASDGSSEAPALDGPATVSNEADEVMYDFGSLPENYLDYYLESNKASSELILAMVAEVRPKWLWIGGFLVIFALSLLALITAIFFRIVTSIVQLPLRTYGDCYRVVWLASISVFILTMLAAVYAPKLILWPWFALALSLIVGSTIAMFIYGKSPLHAIGAYALFWLLGAGLQLGVAYLDYASGKPVSGAAYLVEYSALLRERSGEQKPVPEPSKKKISTAVPTSSGVTQYSIGQEGAPPAKRKDKDDDEDEDDR